MRDISSFALFTWKGMHFQHVILKTEGNVCPRLAPEFFEHGRRCVPIEMSADSGLHRLHVKRTYLPRYVALDLLSASGPQLFSRQVRSLDHRPQITDAVTNDVAAA